MNEGKSVNVVTKKSGLDSALSISEAILHRIISIQGRLGNMDVRLHGEQPEVDGSKDDAPVQNGVIGKLYDVHQATLKRCDCIDDWLCRIEAAI